MLNPKRIDFQPFKYQSEARTKQISLLQQHKCYMNLSSPGIGKTLMTIMLFTKSLSRLPILIICPSQAKAVWEQQIEDFTKEYYNVVNLKNNPNKEIRKKKELENAEIVIINYDIVGKWSNLLINKNFKMCFIDEAHYMQNKSSKRTKAVKTVTKSIEYKAAITATPIDSKVENLFPILDIIKPDLISYRQFVDRFGVPSTGFDGKIQYKECRDTNDLHKFISPYIIRYKKEEVLKDLPPIIPTIIPFEISNKKEYLEASKGLLRFKNGEYQKCKNKLDILPRITQLCLISSKGKLKDGIEWIENFLQSGEKLVVMTRFNNTIDTLYEYFKDISVKYNGSTSEKNKKLYEHRFNNDDSCRLFLGNIKAAGTSISLNKSCSNLVFFDLSFSSSENMQARDRVHRATSVCNCVNIYFFLAKNTIDEKIVDVNNRKLKMLTEIVDSKIDYQGIIDYIK